MSDRPKVTAILLTADRPELTARSIACYVAQTYPLKYRRLYILDSGKTPCTDSLPYEYPKFNIVYHRTAPYGRTYGELRNYANLCALSDDDGAKFLMHWDSDDWYGSTHMAEM